MIDFLYKEAFFLLLVPLLVMAVKKKAGFGQKALKVPFFEDISVIRSGGGRRKISRMFFLRLLVWLIWLSLVTAVARPQSIGEKVLISGENRVMMLVLDASGSMGEHDFIMNGKMVSRFQAMKQIVADFIRKRNGDKIGIVLFGTHAYIYSPPTDDLESLLYLLDTAEIGLVGGNTAIGDGLAMAVKAVMHLPENRRTAILLSDGVSNAGSLKDDEALSLAKAAAMKVYTIGMGTDSLSSFFGIKVIDKAAIDEASLRRIADETGGKYYRSHNSKELEQIYDTINGLEPVVGDDRYFLPVTELFYVPLAAAFLLSVWLFLSITGERRGNGG